jgi:DUF4097 and DUF4098 domain-containing protein YvlB
MRYGVALMMVLLVAALGVSGCTGPDRPAWLSIHPNDWANRGQADDPIVLEVAGPVAIDVQSFNGDIVVTATADPKAKQAKVTIVREGTHGFDRAKEAKASLADISYTAEIVPGELGQVLQLRTSTTNIEPHFQRAHVYIELPEVADLRVHTTNGKVWARNITGSVDVSTSEGDVRIMTNQPMLRPVTIVNRNGDIDYRVRAESTGKIDCQTVNGKVTALVKYGTMNIQPPTRTDLLNATLNSGTNPLVMRTVNGDIRIAVVSNPEHVGQMIVD